MTCILCHDATFEPVAGELRDSTAHAVVRCGGCDLLQLDPLPSAADDAAFYDENRQQAALEPAIDLERLSRKQQPDTLRRAALIERLCRATAPAGRKVLDIGCGYGFFVAEMRRREFDCAGLEVSRFRVALARERLRLELHRCNLLAGSPPELGRHDLVTLFQALEHIARPQEFLERLRALMTPQGRLVIEVPNLDDHMVAANDAYRAFYWQRAHVAYYTRQTLGALLAQAGFDLLEVRYVQRYGLGNFMHWQVMNEPQLAAPDYGGAQRHDWLERHYREELIERGQADTLIAIATVGGDD